MAFHIFLYYRRANHVLKSWFVHIFILKICRWKVEKNLFSWELRRLSQFLSILRLPFYMQSILLFRVTYKFSYTIPFSFLVSRNYCHPIIFHLYITHYHLPAFFSPSFSNMRGNNAAWRKMKYEIKRFLIQNGKIKIVNLVNGECDIVILSRRWNLACTVLDVIQSANYISFKWKKEIVSI